MSNPVIVTKTYMHRAVLKDGTIKEYPYNRTYELIKSRPKEQRADKIGSEVRQEIYAEYLRGTKQCKIAEDFGISQWKISAVIKAEKEKMSASII